MTRRSAATVVVLTLVTCGVYWFYWLYTTTEELKRVTGRSELNPTTDLIINAVTCGLWGIYLHHRNAQVVHAALLAAGRQHEDKSPLILGLTIGALIVGVTGLVAAAILQDELNLLADATATPGVSRV